jgi:type II secretory pathway pseudopilin PulG
VPAFWWRGGGGILGAMIAYVLYNRDTPEQKRAEDLAKRLQAEQVEAELLDADSPRGIQLAENYDITGRPAVVLVDQSGSPVQVWQGADSLPAPSDVAYLAHQ